MTPRSAGHRLHSRRRRGWGAAVWLVLALGGCSGEADPPSADATTAPAVLGTIPAAVVPTPFPMPPGATESTGSSTSEDEVRVQFEVSPATAAELVAFFDEQLEARGWVVRSRRVADGTTRYRIEGHGWTGAVTVFGDLDPVAFLVQLGTVQE